MHVYVEIDVLGRYICVYERVCMDLDYMAWYISFPQYVLQILVVTTRVRSLFKITISGTRHTLTLEHGSWSVNVNARLVHGPGP